MGTVTSFDAPGPHRLVRVAAEEDVGEVRRVVRTVAARCTGLREGVAELAATELAANIVRHSAGGHVLVRPLTGGGLELMAVDRGPGLPPALRARLSAEVGSGPAGPRRAPESSWRPRAGGLGVGLSVVRNGTAVFDWYSDRDGTVILARMGDAAESTLGPWRWGGVNVPLGGDGPSGDAFAVAAGPGGLDAILVDGLGHGPEAAEAARAAITAFGRRTCHGDPSGGGASVDELVIAAHRAMRGTRGGVLGACRVDLGTRQAVFAGVGNVAGAVSTDTGSARLVSHPGTVGIDAADPRVRPDPRPWRPGALLLLCSDGIDSRWDLSARPGLLDRHPAVCAAVLHRDHARGRDDATVLIVRDVRTRKPGQED